MRLTTAEIAKILGHDIPAMDVSLDKISTDSRTVGKGDLFIAIDGDNFDGHDFVADVINDKGAAAAIVQKPVVGVASDRLIIVPDTKRAYLQIGNYVRTHSGAKIIALTGSAGKTTTKEELKFILSKFARTYATEKNFNNTIGVAQTLCNIPHDAEIAIIEIGMSHAGEIAELVPFIAPDIAIVTNVYPMHLENFANLNGIAHAKAEIFSGLAPDGIAIINGDSMHADILTAAAHEKTNNIVEYGKKDLISVSESENLIKVSSDIGDKSVSFALSGAGEHHVSNALCVLNVVNVLGIDVASAAGTLKDFGALDGRGKTHALELQNGGKWTLIDESYSAQPESLKFAIKTLNKIKAAGRKIAVIGKMAEIGTQSQEMHIEIGRVLSDTDIDIVIGICPETKDILSQLSDGMFEKYYFENNDGLENFLTGELLRAGDVVLIKGSHYGSKLFKTVERLLK
ncbi:MAG: UDP-N-acetylmuramoyl-tripeptide--D-alanyl-D-alanine ligase [Rickettsiales bacterium]|jgi:UDP-N-acetylmuramoyl-tripeptide--D-alanyl-D-alanine ligase|nr:UDP-N-acetylmuramoyl-tripeptide--D-alanyl-D-alanine ligase [Rickettsiales bacterium]